MRTLVLVCASGLAREVADVEMALGRYDEIWMVDDDPALRGATCGGALVVGNVESLATVGRCDVVVCAGSGGLRRELVTRLASVGIGSDRFATVIHPSAVVPASCQVGAGSVLLASVVLTSAVVVGEHVVLMPHVTLTHDDRVGDFATLCAGVSLGGSVHVGEGAYVGMNASVRQGLALGADSVLGMGAVLLESIPDEETWVGAPARPAVLRSRVGA